MGSLDKFEEKSFSIHNPQVTKNLGGACNFFNLNSNSLKSIHKKDYSLRPYFTPYVTPRLNEDDFKKVRLKNFFVRNFSASSNGIIKLTSSSKEALYCNKLIIAAGALGSSEIVLRSLGLFGEENYLSFTDHAISPIGITNIEFHEIKNIFFSGFKKQKNLNGHFKYSVDSKPRNDINERYSLFFRKSIFKNISEKEEKIRNAIVSFRSRGLTSKDIKNILLYPHILLSLAALKVGFSGIGSHNQVFCLNTQDKNEGRKIYINEQDNLQLEWLVKNEEVSRKIKFAKDVLKEKFKSFEHKDVKILQEVQLIFPLH